MDKKGAKKDTKVANKTDRSPSKGKTSANRSKSKKDKKEKREKKALSGYNLFAKEERPKIKKELPNLPHTEIFGEIGKRWKDGGDKLQSKWNALAGKDKKDSKGESAKKGTKKTAAEHQKGKKEPDNKKRGTSSKGRKSKASEDAEEEEEE
jgi:hypothetical protein